MKKKPHEGDILGLCPRCLRIRYLTRHHIEPKRINGNGSPIVFLCWDCHQEIEALLPATLRLTFEEYLEITGVFIRGQNAMAAERRI